MASVIERYQASRAFREAIAVPGTLSLIAELKRKSPSKGMLRERFDPVSLAQTLAEAGAAALSVLTDEAYFGGHLDFLRDAKQFTEVPVLRKDFIIDPYQVFEAALYEADAVLLIARVLPEPSLAECLQAAEALAIDPLVEVHSADEVRIAFDGDAVLFSDEAERVYQRDGLDAFTRHETAHALKPLPPGPFKPLLEALHRLQAAAGTDIPVRLRTALVTARSAPTHERAVRTLMDWNIAVDEAMFLGGLDKGAFLAAFEPDFYFDDQRGHVESAQRHVATGHVPFGVANVRRV